MTVRIGWDEYEVALLIDACNRIRDNKMIKQSAYINYQICLDNVQRQMGLT